MTLSKVFIGSSSEARKIANYLQDGLESQGNCEVTPWSQGVFAASDYALESLIRAARETDFAVLVVTADDTVSSRGNDSYAPRDNVIFEIGLCMGILGRERTYLVVAQGASLKLPSDLSGLTWVPYAERTDGNYSSAVNTAVLRISEQINKLGPRKPVGEAVIERILQPVGHAAAFEEELELLMRNAYHQGWTVKETATSLRFFTPRGNRHWFSRHVSDPFGGRVGLRRFVAELRADGLRVNHTLRQPIQSTI